MTQYPPDLSSPFYQRHAQLLQQSFQHLLKQNLLPQPGDIHTLYDAPFALLSHGTEPDPVFNFGNRRALTLFEYSWEAFIRLPSKNSAEPLDRQARQRLLDRVTQNGYIDDYAGVRISSSGRRFQVEDVIVWNVFDTQGNYCGQAAVIGWQ